jgi:hypothetical protein
MLPLFLLANLVTGAINLGTYTLNVPDNVARGIVGSYATVICGVAAVLDAYNICVNSRKVTPLLSLFWAFVSKRVCGKR